MVFSEFLHLPTTGNEALGPFIQGGLDAPVEVGENGWLGIRNHGNQNALGMMGLFLFVQGSKFFGETGQFGN